ncbi:hypothetical protein JCM8097_007577 [Rhodosporidiobolus ruineniae]
MHPSLATLLALFALCTCALTSPSPSAQPTISLPARRSGPLAKQRLQHRALSSHAHSRSRSSAVRARRTSLPILEELEDEASLLRRMEEDERLVRRGILSGLDALPGEATRKLVALEPVVGALVTNLADVEEHERSLKALIGRVRKLKQRRMVRRDASRGGEGKRRMEAVELIGEKASSLL